MNLHGGFAQLILPKGIRQIETIKQLKSGEKSSAGKPNASSEWTSNIYTGLLVDARSIEAIPALAPKLFDENLAEVFGPAFVSREFVVQQVRRVICLSRCHQLGVGMMMYINDYGFYPAHQWRLGDAADTRIRWFNAMASYLAYSIRPLVELLRMRHCPDRFDYGLRYLDRDLPKKLQGINAPPMITFDENLVPGGRKISAWFLIASGFLVGFAAAIMGVGGGFLTFPIFVYTLGVSSMTTVGTDIFQIVFTAGYAAISQYAIYGFIFYTLAMGMLIRSEELV